MIYTNVYDYINVLDKAADASWLRNKAIANNIANVDTPGYKRQDVDFEGALKKAILNNRFVSVDDRVGAITSDELEVGMYTDRSGYSYRLDGNNVDIETESAAMVSNQLKYQALMKAAGVEFANLRTAMSK